MSEGAARQIAGFWRRVAAVLVDGLLLGVVGTLAGWLWFDELAALGSRGRLLGGAIALGYLAVSNSRIGAGRTVGKRVLGIRVATAQGAPPGLARAALRALVLLVPFTLNGTSYWATDGSTLGLVALSVCIFGMGGAIAYLYVFDRRTRRSLHDLAAGTFVIRAAATGPIEGAIWRPHVAIAAGWILAVAVAVVPLTKRLGSMEIMESVLDAQRTAQAVLPDAEVSVRQGVSWRSSEARGTSSARYLQVVVQPQERPGSYEEIADRVAAAVLERPESWEVDQLSIVVVYGYDIMISSQSISRRFSWSPKEWAERLRVGRPPQSTA